MIRDYETETGSVYRIDHENRVWTKIEKHEAEPESDSYVAPLNQLWQGPYENRFSQDGWNEVEFPSVGMSMYIFGKMGRRLYYYHKDGGIELDFVIRYCGECVPVECKATTGNSKSLRTVLKHHEKYHVNYCIKLGDYNIGRKENIFTIPMYMAFMLTSV